jgi:hypothetical protein
VNADQASERRLGSSTVQAWALGIEGDEPDPRLASSET